MNYLIINIRISLFSITLVQSKKTIEKNKDLFFKHDIAKKFYFLLSDVLKTPINAFIQKNNINERSEEKSKPA